MVATPGGLESFFPTIARRRPETVAQIAAIARDFGLSFLPDENRNVA